MFHRLSSSRAFLGFCGFALLLGTWLRDSAAVSAAVREGLSLCARVLIPSLFPFFVLSNLFVRRGYHQFVSAALRPVMGPLFGLPADAAGALALGAVGGYPIGAATAFDLYGHGKLTGRETARLLCFCNNAGPGFIFGVVGLGLFQSVPAGLRLYAAHLAGALLAGIGARILSGASAPPAPPFSPEEAGESFPASFTASVRAAASSMLNVCAFLVFFSVLLAFLHQTRIWTLPARLPGAGADTARAILDGFLELSHGIEALRALPERTAMAAASFLLGWGGLCVHCQVLSISAGRDVDMGPYYRGKLAQGLLAALLTLYPLPGLVLCAAGLGLLAAGEKFQKPSGKKDVRGV